MSHNPTGNPHSFYNKRSCYGRCGPRSAGWDDIVNMEERGVDNSNNCAGERSADEHNVWDGSGD